MIKGYFPSTTNNINIANCKISSLCEQAMCHISNVTCYIPFIHAYDHNSSVNLCILTQYHLSVPFTNHIRVRILKFESLKYLIRIKYLRAHVIPLYTQNNIKNLCVLVNLSIIIFWKTPNMELSVSKIMISFDDP